MTATIEDLVKLTALIGIPVVGGVVAFMSMIWSIKSDLRRIETLLMERHDSLSGRVTKAETNIHEIRNTLQTVVLKQARQEGDQYE